MYNLKRKVFNVQRCSNPSNGVISTAPEHYGNLWTVLEREKLQSITTTILILKVFQTTIVRLPRRKRDILFMAVCFASHREKLWFIF